MDLVAYVRVSTAKQSDAYGPDAQLAEIRKWAKANGHRIASVYEDAISGTSDPAERPGLSDALDQLRPPPKGKGLIVARMDRLARALHLQESILQVVWRVDATVFTADAGEVRQDDPDDPMRTFVRQVIGGAAQLERTLIVKRMRDGRNAKAAAGKHSVGAYAFGFQGAGTGRDRDAVPLSDEQDTIQRILALRQAGESYKSIAHTLDGEKRKPRRAQNWSRMAVRNIVERVQAQA